LKFDEHNFLVLSAIYYISRPFSKSFCQFSLFISCKTGKEQLIIVLLKPVLETRAKLAAETQLSYKNFQFRRNLVSYPKNSENFSEFFVFKFWQLFSDWPHSVKNVSLYRVAKPNIPVWKPRLIIKLPGNHQTLSVKLLLKEIFSHL
jgi:hypothetical protein